LWAGKTKMNEGHWEKKALEDQKASQSKKDAGKSSATFRTAGRTRQIAFRVGECFAL